MVGIHLRNVATLRPSRPQPLAIAFWWVSDLVLPAALDHIALAKVTAIGQTSTLFVTLLAPFLQPKNRMAAVTARMIGFAGTVILIEPGTSD